MKQLPKWEQQDSVVLYEEVKKVLSVAICRWTGVPINDQDIGILSEQFEDLFESAGRIGIKHMKGKSHVRV